MKYLIYWFTHPSFETKKQLITFWVGLLVFYVIGRLLVYYKVLSLSEGLIKYAIIHPNVGFFIRHMDYACQGGLVVFAALFVVSVLLGVIVGIVAGLASLCGDVYKNAKKAYEDDLHIREKNMLTKIFKKSSTKSVKQSGTKKI